MSNLYNIIKKIVNVDSNEEAEQLLYGESGIQINSREYYQNIISNFIKKKETVIKKQNGNLLFDLDNQNDIWNIIFIAEYIKSNDLLFKEYNELNEKINIAKQELNNVKRKHKNVSTIEEHNQINQEYKSKKINLDNQMFLLEQLNSVKQTFYNIDWISLGSKSNSLFNQKSIEILKQSVNIIHKLRNSFEHEIINYDKKIRIDNSNFKVEIPIEYLQGFYSGRIIANLEDYAIVEQTNEIVFPLLRELDFDPRKLESFFYNVDPTILSLLLSYCDNNIDDLYKLPIEIFTKNEWQIKTIIEYSNNNIFTLEQLCKLPDEVFIPFVQKKGEDNLLNYAINNGLLYEDIKKLSYWDSKSTILKVFDFGKTNNLSPKKLVKFNNFSSLYQMFRNSKFDDGENLQTFANYCKINNINFESILNAKNSTILRFNKNTIVINEYLKKNNINSNLLFQLPEDAFYSGNNTIEIIDYFKKNEIAFENLSKLGNKLFCDFENIIKMYNLIKKYNLNISFLIDISINSIEYIDNTEILFEKFREYGFSYDDILKLPAVAFNKINNTLEILDCLKKCNLTISEFNDLDKNCLHSIFDYSDNFLKLLTIYPIELIKKLPEEAYFDANNTIDVLEYLKKEKCDINYILNKTREEVSDIVEKTIVNVMFAPYYRKNLFKLFTYIKSRNIEISKILKLPAISISGGDNKENDRIENTIQIIETCLQINKDFTKISYESYRNNITPPILEKYFKDKNINFDMTKIPIKLLNCKIKLENLDYLIERVNRNIDRLDEFPLEFFCCDTNILKELVSKYDCNLCRSIFGINNPKIIGLLIYMNNVFSDYQKENLDYNIVDIDPITIIHSAFNSTYLLKNNIIDIDINQETYLKQFIYNTETSSHRNVDEIKLFILDKLRNSGAHFRFKLVKDINGKIIDDKIYLYDKYDEINTTNFNIIIDIKDLIEIIREVEIGLSKKRNEYIGVEENRFAVKKTK